MGKREMVVLEGGGEQEVGTRARSQTTEEVVLEVSCDGHGVETEGGVVDLFPTERDVTRVQRECSRTRDWGHTPSW